MNLNLSVMHPAVTVTLFDAKLECAVVTKVIKVEWVFGVRHTVQFEVCPNPFSRAVWAYAFLVTTKVPMTFIHDSSVIQIAVAFVDTKSNIGVIH